MDQFNVLLIEDDDVDAEAAERELTKFPYLRPPGKVTLNILRATTFEKGLSATLTHKDIDVILLDLNLPDGRGLTLIEQLNRAGNRAPIVVLTGQDAQEAMGLDSVRMGAQDYLCKCRIEGGNLSRCIRYAVERHQLTKRLHDQTRQLTETNEDLESFVYIASHDLRSPLLNLHGFSTELAHSLDRIHNIIAPKIDIFPADEKKSLADELNELAPRSLQFIQHSTEKMDQLTTAILQLSRLNRSTLEPEPIDTGGLVRQCLDGLERQIRAAGAEVTVEPLPRITADRATITHVFANILDNAVKYLLAERRGQITVSASTRPEGTVFCIRDNGRGIDEQDRHKVFEIFRRAANAQTVSGDGMGMPFVRNIIKRHNGEIWFESSPNEGTAFYFTIGECMENEPA